MIEIVDEKLLDSDCNFLINITDIEENIDNKIATKYPHVEREYLIYLKYCRKNKQKIIGTIQYIPIDTWALIMCDTINNRYVLEYDKEYQYIVNVFCPEGKINNKTMIKTFAEISEKAKLINATVGILYSNNKYKKITLNELQNQCNKIFEGINTKIYLDS